MCKFNIKYQDKQDFSLISYKNNSPSENNQTTMALCSNNKDNIVKQMSGDR